MALVKSAKLTGFNGPFWYTSDGVNGGYGVGGEEAVESMLDLLYEKGVRYLRNGGSDPVFTSATLSSHYWARIAKSKGFNVLLGLARTGQGNTTTPTTWKTHEALVLAELAITRDNNECDVFSIGNEEEERIGTQSIATLTRASNVVTATFSAAHNYLTGDTVIIAGATPSDYNGTVTITDVPTPTTFTYTASGVDGSASGTLTAKMTVATFIRLAKETAVACRAVAPDLEYIYTSTETRVSDWASAGITPGTDLDYYGLNTYAGSATDTSTFRTKVQTGYDAFAERMFVTEWNIFYNWPTATGQASYERGQGYARERFNILEDIGVERAYYYVPTAGNVSNVLVHDYEILEYTDNTPRNFYYIFFNERPEYKIFDYTSANTIINPTLPVKDYRDLIAADRGKCVDFNQTDSYLSGVYPSVFTAANLTEFTLAVRLYTRSLGGSSAGRVISNINQKFVEILVGSGGYNCQIWHSTTSATAQTGANTILLNTWQTLIMEFSDDWNYPKIYLDRRERTSSPTSKSGNRGDCAGETISIGNRSDLIRGYDGLQDDFFIWNRLLDSAERNAYHNGEIPTGYLIGYTMDEVSGNVLDQGAYSANLTASQVTQNTTSLVI